MKRMLLTAAAVVALGASLDTASAGKPRLFKPQPNKHFVVRDSEYVLVPRHGKMTVRQVYPGYTDHFAPPAMFYYGYPWAERSYGPGF